MEGGDYLLSVGNRLAEVPEFGLYPKGWLFFKVRGMTYARFQTRIHLPDCHLCFAEGSPSLATAASGMAGSRDPPAQRVN
jgi:hypothetical protein